MDEHGPDVPEEVKRQSIFALVPYSTERKYLPTLAEMVDRLGIVLLKSIFISQHRQAYDDERARLEHDIGLLLTEQKVDGEMITAILMTMLCNRAIWESEAAARAGGTNTLDQLRFTHSCNGVRSHAKNIIARKAGERVDHKRDCFAEDLVEDFGAWNVLPD